jgi:hypothetical protein
MTNMKNKESAEARECTFSSEIYGVTMPYMRTQCHGQTDKRSNCLQFPLKPTLPFFSDGPELQIILLIHCDNRW